MCYCRAEDEFSDFHRLHLQVLFQEFVLADFRIVGPKLICLSKGLCCGLMLTHSIQSDPQIKMGLSKIILYRNGLPKETGGDLVMALNEMVNTFIILLRRSLIGHALRGRQ